METKERERETHTTVITEPVFFFSRSRGEFRAPKFRKLRQRTYSRREETEQRDDRFRFCIPEYNGTRSGNPRSEISRN